jgi:hypothetical protein
MIKIRILSLSLIFLQSVNAIALQPTLRSGVARPSAQAVVVENSIVALARVLHQWSGHRRYENLVVALADEVAKHDSVDPLVTTAARMAHLAIGLRRQELYREAYAVIQALKPEVAASLRSNQQIFWRIDRQPSKLTIYEQLEAKQSNQQIFETEIFEGEDTDDGNYIDRESRRHNLDVEDVRIRSSEDYISDALYGSFEDQVGGARDSRQNSIVQKMLAGREAESISAGGQYFRDIIDDGMRGAGIGGVGGGIVGLYIAGPAGAATMGTIGGAGGFIVGAAAGAITRHDDYQKGKEAEAQAEQKKADEEKQKQQKNEQEKAEKIDHERKEQAKKDEEEVDRLNLGQQTSNTATGVNPDRVDDKGSSILRLMELLTHYRKLINVRDGDDAGRGLVILEMPNTSCMDPGRFDVEHPRSGSMSFDQAGVTDPGKNGMLRGVGR